MSQKNVYVPANVRSQLEAWETMTISLFGKLRNQLHQQPMDKPITQESTWVKFKQTMEEVAQISKELTQSRVITQNLDDTYNALESLEGIGGKGYPNASQDIDELLYGKNGVWRDEPK